MAMVEYNRVTKRKDNFFYRVAKTLYIALVYTETYELRVQLNFWIQCHFDNYRDITKYKTKMPMLVLIWEKIEIQNDQLSYNKCIILAN